MFNSCENQNTNNTDNFANVDALPSVLVGKTSLPLKSSPELKGVVPHFGNGNDDNNKVSFNLVDGPPYANGAPHLGHVLNKHIKDALARTANLLNYGVSWRPGWDCHGLPLELLVESQGFDRFDKPTFASAAREFAQSQVDLQASVFKDQGWCASWDNPYKTMDPVMEAGTMRVFASMLDRGVVQVRHTSVPWCGKCQSTLSGAESEDATVNQQSWVVPFFFNERECFLSWTTTPWTLPLHKNLALNPDAQYVALEKEGQLAWVSVDTANRWANELEATITSNTKMGYEFANTTYKTPWMENTLAMETLVLSHAGTGVLHAVPGLSDLDTKLGEKNNWTLLSHLSVEGLVENSPLEEENGLYASNKASNVVRPFYENGPWFKVLEEKVSLPHCWRHKTPLLTRPSRQVFLHLSSQTRQFAHDLVDRMEFTPKSAKNRLLASMKTRPDWCVSRQRSWGVPLALFLDKNTGQPHPLSSKWVQDMAQRVESEGLEAWWNTATKDVVGEDFVDSVERVDDVLDVWFDSGCVPQLLGQSNVVVEGTDQHRGWFQSCVWVSALLNANNENHCEVLQSTKDHLQKSLPFKRVVTHGFVLDGSGQKLSKSKGGDKSQKGQKAPLWNTLPTDVVRLWSLMGSEGMDKSWSVDSVKLATSASNRLRGVYRFLLANCLDNNTTDFSRDSLSVWDRYWWERLENMHKEVLSLLSRGYTGEALSVLLPFAENYSSTLLGSWKDRLYCSSKNNFNRQQLDHLLKQHLNLWNDLLQVFMPRLCFEAKELLPATKKVNALKLNDEQKNEVEKVLEIKSLLAPVMESLGKQKIQPTHRRLVWSNAPNWPGQLLADALDVGQLGSFVEGMQKVSMGDMEFYVGKSPNDVCPRCRRVQEKFVGQVCNHCVSNCS